MDDGGRKLEEVAKVAGVSPRTVRYYIQRGLLPQPRFRGPDTSYGDEHLVRLRAIRRLQDAFWPLEAIAGLLASKTAREIDAIADGTEVPAPSGGAPNEPAPPAALPRAVATIRHDTQVRRETQVRRIQLTADLVLEVPAQAGDDTEALVDKIRALIARRR